MTTSCRINSKEIIKYNIRNTEHQAEMGSQSQMCLEHPSNHLQLGEMLSQHNQFNFFLGGGLVTGDPRSIQNSVQTVTQAQGRNSDPGAVRWQHYSFEIYLRIGIPKESSCLTNSGMSQNYFGQWTGLVRIPLWRGKIRQKSFWKWIWLDGIPLREGGIGQRSPREHWWIGKNSSVSR